MPPLKQAELRHVVDVIRPSFEEALAHLRGGEDFRDGARAALTSPTGRTSAFRHPGNVRCWRVTNLSQLLMWCRIAGRYGDGFSLDFGSRSTE